MSGGSRTRTLEILFALVFEVPKRQVSVSHRTWQAEFHSSTEAFSSFCEQSQFQCRCCRREHMSSAQLDIPLSHNYRCDAPSLTQVFFCFEDENFQCWLGGSPTRTFKIFCVDFQSTLMIESCEPFYLAGRVSFWRCGLFKFSCRVPISVYVLPKRAHAVCPAQHSIVTGLQA